MSDFVKIPPQATHATYHFRLFVNLVYEDYKYAVNFHGDEQFTLT